MSEKDSKILKAPEGVSAEGVVEDIVTAQLKAVIALPAILVDLIDGVDNLAAAVAPIGLYFRKKGIDEGLFGPEDLKELEDDEDEGEENEPAN